MAAARCNSWSAASRSGGVYASLALALVLIHRTTHVVNFAQGEMAMVTTFIAWSLLDTTCRTGPRSCSRSGSRSSGGAAIERTVIRPVVNASPLTVVMVTVGARDP